MSTNPGVTILPRASIKPGPTLPTAVMRSPSIPISPLRAGALFRRQGFPRGSLHRAFHTPLVCSNCWLGEPYWKRMELKRKTGHRGRFKETKRVRVVLLLECRRLRFPRPPHRQTASDALLSLRERIRSTSVLRQMGRQGKSPHNPTAPSQPRQSGSDTQLRSTDIPSAPTDAPNPATTFRVRLQLESTAAHAPNPVPSWVPVRTIAEYNGIIAPVFLRQKRCGQDGSPEPHVAAQSNQSHLPRCRLQGMGQENPSRRSHERSPQRTVG